MKKQYQLGTFHVRPLQLSHGFCAITEFSDLIKLYLTYYDVAIANLAPWSLTQVATSRYLAGADVKYEYFQLESIVADSEKLIKVKKSFLLRWEFC